MSETHHRSVWGWGYREHALSDAETAEVRDRLVPLFDRELEVRRPPNVDDLDLRPPRVTAPTALASLFSFDPTDRAGHHYGKSYRDVVRGFAGHYPTPPDAVVRPAVERDVVAILEWCASRRVAAVPYGGGSSVVGGVETTHDGDHAAVVSVDLGSLDQVLEVDRVSRAARIQAGVLGPALEDRLREHGLTLRHFPQSFELSSLGGWIATRSAGHFATLTTHIDDFVESTRTVTPQGVLETRRLPASGAGPSPDRLILGSEGTLGIVTEAWMRLQDRPTNRARETFCFEGATAFTDAAEALRLLGQSGLHPANCRLLDPLEAMISGAGDGQHALLIVAFESADHPVDASMDRAVEICRSAGGTAEPTADRASSADIWRSSFLRAPYLRNALVTIGVLNETFETAITWDRFAGFVDSVRGAALDAVVRICGTGLVTVRVTHVYPDGAAPYFTVLAPAARGDELRQWDEIKQAASEAIVGGGGTITHHHAVGRDHRPWYDRQRPELFASAWRAAKATVDPLGIMNPGVLIDAG